MSIEKISSGLPTTTKIDQLNDMILELSGLVTSGKFDSNELSQLYADASYLSRKYLRDVALGHTVATYTGWTHLRAESGYSIWKFTPTTYTYNALNQLYFDGKVYDNRLSATSESLTAFDFVYKYNGFDTVYTDNTTEASTEAGTSFTLMDGTDDFLYLGEAAVFNGVDFEFEQRGSNYTLVVQYWNGSAWTTMTSNTDSLVDSTVGWTGDGRITWTNPGSWSTTSVNGQNKFWIRISTSTVPTTVANAFLIIPNDSVVALLRLSSDEFFKEDFAWCSFSGSVYVTIKNTGTAAYEGSAFITSASSANNLKNYFVYNHTFSLDYQNSTWVDGEVTLTDTATPALDASLGNGVFFLTATGDRTIAVPTNAVKGKRITIKHLASGGTRTLALNAGAGGFRFGSTITALTATASGKTDYIDALYNVSVNFWEVVQVVKGY